MREMAGVVGFEPTVRGTKNRCLTTWLHPNGERLIKLPSAAVQDPNWQNPLAIHAGLPDSADLPLSMPRVLRRQYGPVPRLPMRLRHQVAPQVCRQQA